MKRGASTAVAGTLSELKAKNIPTPTCSNPVDVTGMKNSSLTLNSVRFATKLKLC